MRGNFALWMVQLMVPLALALPHALVLAPGAAWWMVLLVSLALALPHALVLAPGAAWWMVLPLSVVSDAWLVPSASL